MDIEIEHFSNQPMETIVKLQGFERNSLFSENVSSSSNASNYYVFFVLLPN